MQANPASPGRVFLVGAGPGDPDLLTLRAARLLMNAALIVHDGLVDPAILAMAKPSARLVSVAKSRARHTMKQEEINALLVREALAGHDVVRLKGGDPFVFGRGGEEAEACHAAGVPVEVIENATRSAMRVLRGPLAGLADLIADAKVQSPALIVIGHVTAEPDNTIRALALEATK
jgi:siroheme synthase